MTHVYRISKGPDIGDILDSIESLETFARDDGPGRCDVDRHSLDVSRSGQTLSGWGVVIDRYEATVGADRDPSPSRSQSLA
jgi:hypothetical protein